MGPPFHFFSRRKAVGYTGLSRDSSELDKERLLKSPGTSPSSSDSSIDEDEQPHHKTQCNDSHRMNVITILNALFFFISSFLFGASFLGGGQTNISGERNYFLKQTSEPCK